MQKDRPAKIVVGVDFLMRLLHARTLGSLSARFLFFAYVSYHQGTHSCRPPATSRMQAPPHSTLYCSFPRCILTDVKPRFTSRACPKHNHIEHTYAASEYSTRYDFPHLTHLVDDRSEVDANDDICSTTPTISTFVMQFACVMQYGQSTTATDHNF